MSQHTKHHNLHGEVGKFFPPPHEGFPRPRTSKWTRITPRNTPATLFHVVSRQFRRFWASVLAQKMGYKTVFCYYLLKYWTKLNGSGRLLSALNSICLQYLVGFSNRSHQKVIMFKFEKSRIFWLFWVTQIWVQHNS